MKLVVANVQDQDAEGVVKALNAAHFRVTRIGSTGGFLHEGNSTLIIGVDDHLVDRVVAELKRNSQRRKKYLPIAGGAVPAAETFYNFIEVEVGGAVVFVLDVEHFEQI
jgi:uncharacterized protein YaaQ